jgi:hypothetical protein
VFAAATAVPITRVMHLEGQNVCAKMGYDKVHDHARAGAEYIVSADSSCLIHQRGCAERIGAAE